MKGRVALLTLFSVLFAKSASAIQVPEVVTDTLRDVFTSVPEEWVIRFAYWIILFTILYFVTSKFVFKEKGSTSGILAFTVSLIAAISTPATLLNLIFSTYAWLGGILLLLAPILGVVYLVKKFTDTWYSHLLKMVIFLIAAGLFGYLATSVDITFLGNNAIVGVTTFAWIGSVVFVFAAIFQFMAFLAKMTGHSWGARTHRGGTKERFDRTAKNAKKDEKKDRGDIEDRERDMEAYERHIMKYLRNLRNALQAIQQGTPQQREQMLNTIKSSVDAISGQIDRLEADMRRRDKEIRELESIIMDDHKLDELVQEEEKAISQFKNGFSLVLSNLRKVFTPGMQEQQRLQLLQQTQGYVDKLIYLGEKLEIEEKDVEHEVES